MILGFFKQMYKNANGFAEMADMLWCALRYGASPNNYRDFGFSQLSAQQRATFMTNGLSRKLIRRSNNSRYIDFFEDKIKFAQRFENYFGREWISAIDLDYENFCSFVAEKKKFIYKPLFNSQGKGIVVFDDLSDIEGAYTRLKALDENAILEEWICQHPTLSQVYDQAINCLRIITFRQGEEVYFLAGGMTWGNGEKIANASASGIVSPINLDTGVLDKVAADFHGATYSQHPITGADIVGLQIPYWKEVKDMLVRAAKEILQTPYIGWDVAITPEAPVIIEGNTRPGYRYYQIPVHVENGIGNRAKYERFLK